MGYPCRFDYHMIFIVGCISSIHPLYEIDKILKYTRQHCVLFVGKHVNDGADAHERNGQSARAHEKNAGRKMNIIANNQFLTGVLSAGGAVCAMGFISPVFQSSSSVFFPHCCCFDQCTRPTTKRRKQKHTNEKKDSVDKCPFETK